MVHANARLRSLIAGTKCIFTKEITSNCYSLTLAYLLFRRFLKELVVYFKAKCFYCYIKLLQ